MCGIFAILFARGTYDEVRSRAVRLSLRQRHRGPDGSGVHMIEVAENTYHVFVHERLNIVDASEKGRQPFSIKEDPNLVWIHNGENYNYQEDRPALEGKYTFRSHSDSEIIGPLYKERGFEGLLHALEGMWAFILYDHSLKRFYIGRDHVGIIPLYWGHNSQGEVYAASELKAIHDRVPNVQQLLPGHYVTNELQHVMWYKPAWHNLELIPDNKVDYAELRQQLERVVRHELIGDAAFGLFISGGVDSSIVAGIVMRMVKNGEIDIKKRGMTKVHSFCIGLKGSPDLFYAKKVADFLGTEHHSFTYTVEEGLDAIPEVVYHTETWNNTTIRASTPMYLMSRKIKALGIKVCLTGEGADEIFGGYLYFHKAPDRKEFHQECVRKVQDLYKYDLLRANKSCLAWGIEVRPPFMNKKFVEYVMSIDAQWKMPSSHDQPIEKYILRKAFDFETDPIVPKEILWRQKEQFSDGVGYLWRDGIRDKVERIISDEEFNRREQTFPVNPPRDKEQYWYRRIFSEHFPSDASTLTVPYAKSIACSTEKALEWDESFKKNTDESGRAVIQVHRDQTQTILEQTEEEEIKE